MKRLPLNIDLETKVVLKKVILANRALGKLNGIAKIIPNQSILINSLILREAKNSSEIENIITTYDEIYQASISDDNLKQATKEVKNYSTALLKGFDFIKNEELFLIKHIIKIQEELEQNNAGIRKQAGTILKNPATGEIKYIPPQSYKEILDFLANLENYINNDKVDDYDYIIKMAIIHFQFEAIHPFYDGNGRTGRIINILYLVYKKLLDLPILYLSDYIIKNKKKYYELIDNVHKLNDWNSWIVYIIEGVEVTALETIKIIEEINTLMEKTKLKINIELPKIYSKDLLEIIFSYPYTKIDFLVKKLNITRKTASNYLSKLEDIGILKSIKYGRVKFFVNKELFDLLKHG